MRTDSFWSLSEQRAPPPPAPAPQLACTCSCARTCAMPTRARTCCQPHLHVHVHEHEHERAVACRAAADRRSGAAHVRHRGLRLSGDRRARALRARQRWAAAPPRSLFLLFPFFSCFATRRTPLCSVCGPRTTLSMTWPGQAVARWWRSCCSRTRTLPGRSSRRSPSRTTAWGRRGCCSWLRVSATTPRSPRLTSPPTTPAPKPWRPCAEPSARRRCAPSTSRSTTPAPAARPRSATPATEAPAQPPGPAQPSLARCSVSGALHPRPFHPRLLPTSRASRRCASCCGAGSS